VLDSDKSAFAQMLTTTFTVYSRPAPDSNAMRVWFRLLEQFPLEMVQRAFDHFVATEPKFPPTPAAIRDLLGANADNRPGVDEAWAIALTSRDEAETIVWTTETAEAFAACRPVLDMGDEVGARMAFKDAYGRICGTAKQRGEPVRWVASVGFDKARREAVLRKAESAGLLPAPQVAALLPPPEPELTEAEKEIARQHTKKLMEMLAQGRANRDADMAAAAQASRDRVAAEKAEIAAKVEKYQRRAA